MNLIKLCNISKAYRYHKQNIIALKEINVEIEKGDFIILSGSSGAGKSTLLNIISGLITPTTGEYYFDSQRVDMSERGLADLRNKHMGIILQDFALINDRNVYYNIALPLLYKKIDKKKIEDQVANITQIMGIYDLIKKKPYTLSRGERQRVAFARAMVTKPDIIIADEPTSSLDKDNSVMVMNMLRDYNNNGNTIIMSTHNESQMNDNDKVIALHN